MAKKLHIITTIELMAGNKEFTEKTLKDYVEKLSKEKYITVERTDFSEISKLENPPQNVKEAFWQSVEIEADFDSLKNLLKFTMKYGPSSVEIMAPKSMEIKAHEIQDITAYLTEFMHSFAAQGAGGIVVAR